MEAHYDGPSHAPSYSETEDSASSAFVQPTQPVVVPKVLEENLPDRAQVRIREAMIASGYMPGFAPEIRAGALDHLPAAVVARVALTYDDQQIADLSRLHLSMQRAAQLTMPMPVSRSMFQRAVDGVRRALAYMLAPALRYYAWERSAAVRDAVEKGELKLKHKLGEQTVTHNARIRVMETEHHAELNEEKAKTKQQSARAAKLNALYKDEKAQAEHFRREATRQVEIGNGYLKQLSLTKQELGYERLERMTIERRYKDVLAQKVALERGDHGIASLPHVSVKGAKNLDEVIDMFEVEVAIRQADEAELDKLSTAELLALVEASQRKRKEEELAKQQAEAAQVIATARINTASIEPAKIVGEPFAPGSNAAILARIREKSQNPDGEKRPYYVAHGKYFSTKADARAYGEIYGREKDDNPSGRLNWDRY